MFAFGNLIACVETPRDSSHMIGEMRDPHIDPKCGERNKAVSWLMSINTALLLVNLEGELQKSILKCTWSSIIIYVLIRCSNIVL